MTFYAEPPKRNTTCYTVYIDSVALLFSYGTLVGVSTPDETLRAPPGAYSRTTGRHINESGFENGRHASLLELKDAAYKAIAQGALEAIKYKLAA